MAVELSGTRLQYRVGHEIGRGRMGVVYEAWDAQLGRLIALKTIEGGRRARVPNDIENARTLARLEHPGIVPIYDAGTLPDGRVFCAMRLVRGKRLDDFFFTERGLIERIRVFQKICDAVAYAHNCGVVHRDLQPHNVIVGSFGEVYVMDWGVAEWLIGPDGAAGIEREALGSMPRYTAPEQSGGRPEAVDGRADIFSLGAILQDATRGESSRSLAAIASKALSPDPAERYAAVEDLASDVQRFLEQLPVSASEESIPERLSRFAERNRILLLVLATYVLVRIALFLLEGR